MKSRVTQDRHFDCRPGRCVASTPRLRGTQQPGACIPRRCWWLKTRDGAGARVSFAFATEDEARVAAARVDAARVLGQEYRPKTITPPSFKAVAEEALRLHAQSFRLRSLRNHESFLTHHLLPYFGDKPMVPATFSPLELKRFVATLRERLADSSIKASLPCLRVIVDHLVERGVLPSNPLRSGARLWKLEGSDVVDPFSASEVRSIIKAARSISPDLATLIQLTVQTSARRGEVLGLRRCDVQGEMLHIQGSLGRNGQRGPTKNPYSVRRVSLLHPVLEDRPAWHPREAGILTRRVLDGLAVLIATTPDAEAQLFPFTAHQLEHLWTRTLALAQVRYRKFHALRHAWSSILFSRRAPIPYLVKMGGWKNAVTFLTVYAKWDPDEDSARIPARSEASPEFSKTAGLTV